MWRTRNSLSQLTQLASSKSRCHLNIQHTSLITRSSSTAVDSSSGSEKLGFSGLDRVQAIGSAAVVGDTTSLGFRGVADVAKHYGRCYWELSKAKLRSSA